ncbi:zinc ABC transporter ATP-binding protein AztA [Microbacterium alcoholitolerans]|uniref:zinc ABC transporter ATP-binding protein AztA n=1 Tax=unclassified Microbacterium TaxID=2609290 RepID=UPI003D183113
MLIASSSGSPAVGVLPAASLSRIRVLFNGHAALDGVSLRASRAALTVLTGPNGAGKSTLLEVLAGTRAVNSGTRSVEGTVAFVPQRAAIPPRLPMTVRDVVTVGAWGRTGLRGRMASDTRRLVQCALERTDIAALARKPFAALSGGQQQRALLAQGIVREADLLLLDEPTTGLDAASSRRIREIMREEVVRGAAVVCVSHDSDVIAEGDAIVKLAEGRIAGSTELDAADQSTSRAGSSRMDATSAMNRLMPSPSITR